MNSVEKQSSSQEPDITLTAAAQQHVLSSIEKHGNGRSIRLSVKKTGCSGLSYQMDYVEMASPEDIQQHLSDNLLLFIDKKSYPYLKGMQIDYVKQGLNHKLVFLNPNQTGQCGCGESFTVG